VSALHEAELELWRTKRERLSASLHLPVRALDVSNRTACLYRIQTSGRIP
jgi:hypothetical protein